MSIIVGDEITPSCPKFLAITKQLTVVAEPSITRIAISSLSLNPKATAIGRNTATKPTSLINVAANAGFAFADAFFKSKVAPIAISPIGVAILPMLVTAFAGIPANGRPIADHRSPATIPKIIGLVAIPLNVYLSTALSMPFCPGLKNESTITAITL